MAGDLKVSVTREIQQLKKSIARASTQLASLRERLKRRERVYGLLDAENNRGRRSRKMRRGRRGPTVNWNSVLKRLPATFTVDHMAKSGAVKTKSRAYLRQVVVRWAREGKIKRTGRGKYQKGSR